MLKQFKLFSLVKQFLIQTIQFSISIIFVYIQLTVKTVLFQTIQFSISTVSMSRTVLFQTIQFSISMQFSSIQPIDMTLSGATTPWRSALHSLKFEHYSNLTIKLLSVISRTLVGGGLTPLERCSRCTLLPQPTEQQ